MEKLRCDRCGMIYRDRGSIDMAKKYAEEWRQACERDGERSRGISSCPIITCDGELILEE